GHQGLQSPAMRRVGIAVDVLEPSRRAGVERNSDARRRPGQASADRLEIRFLSRPAVEEALESIGRRQSIEPCAFFQREHAFRDRLEIRQRSKTLDVYADPPAASHDVQAETL